MKENQRKIYVAFLAMKLTFDEMRSLNQVGLIDVGAVLKKYLTTSVNKNDAELLAEVNTFLDQMPSMRYIPNVEDLRQK